MTNAVTSPFTLGRQARLKLIVQSEVAECALACLAMVANYHGHHVDLPGLRRRFGTSLQGMKLGRVVDLAAALGLNARTLRSEIGYLSKAKTPCILHWNFNHFVVFNGVRRGRADIFDPARGRYSLSLAELSNHFTGLLVELTPSPSFAPINDRRSTTLKALIGPISGLRRTLAQVLILALAIELLALALPFQMQLVLDQVILSNDRSFLAVTIAAFLVLAACQSGLTLIRGWLISWFGVSLSTQWTNNLFGHLIKLPIDFFTKRHLGDIVSRFSSIKTVQGTLTGAFIEALLNGLMSIFSLLILWVYSPPLTLVVLACFALYATLRLLSYRRLHAIQEEQLVYAARQQSELMESIRGIQPIKLANKERLRWTRMANATHEASDRDMRAQQLAITFGAISQGLFAAQRTLVLALGALMAMRDAFSVGMLVAFLTYADQFTLKSSGFIDKFVGLKLLKLHGERIGEIALQESEQGLNDTSMKRHSIGRIELRGVSFRYEKDGPFILHNVSFSIEPGESVAIVGKSGCGKSTLAKIVLGLLTPSSGIILVDGVELRTYGLARYRAAVAAVMQDDQLFAGSILENIAFFDTEPCVSEVEQCARDAAVHEDIARFPMGYETLVGDMGSSLSGGQKQRVLLARALYQKASLLVLDEATSHLDADSERQVNQNIGTLGRTKLVIAHRQETVNQCDRVLSLESLSSPSRPVHA
ncbi:peptidase domain-containing ABC transporter [Dyella sp. EPa41]|uniref:peptidase domain-containing ABC transporter n=1 Tax=Dyella sp. EPa41 TaxID=1561194 RepID=UPI001915BDDF|nr:peptidase domain-containing ABC transporter [Dyella sp. EPa41]